RDAQQRGDLFAGLLRGRVDLAQRLAGLAARTGGDRLGQFHVGRVVGGVRVQDGVLAGLGDDLEFVRGAAADGAGVGRDRAVPQAQPGEDASVGLVHVPVFGGE